MPPNFSIPSVLGILAFPIIPPMATITYGIEDFFSQVLERYKTGRALGGQFLFSYRVFKSRALTQAYYRYSNVFHHVCKLLLEIGMMEYLLTARSNTTILRPCLK